MEKIKKDFEMLTIKIIIFIITNFNYWIISQIIKFLISD